MSGIFDIQFSVIKALTLQVGRVRTVIADGVKEIWLSSEDTGAYGNFF